MNYQMKTTLLLSFKAVCIYYLKNLFKQYVYLFKLLLDYRGYSIRKDRGYEFDEELKKILDNCANKEEARQALINSGVSDKEAIFIIHRWYRQQMKIKRKLLRNPDEHVHSKLRQVELIQFSQDVKIYFIYKINFSFK